MPDNQTPNVKARLGMKSEQKLTLNKNVFNRLGAWYKIVRYFFNGQI